MDSMNSGWLKQLAPPHAPPPPGWWPPAPGWWLLALLLVLFVAGLIYWYLRPFRRLRRIALRELAHLEAYVHDDFQLARELQDLLRRYAIAAYGREAVANLSGDEWLSFIASHGGKELADEAGKRLLRVAYGGLMQCDRRAWLKGAHNFLQGRR